MSYYTIYTKEVAPPFRYITEREAMLREEIEVYEERVKSAVIELETLRRELAVRRHEMAGIKADIYPKEALS